MLSSFLLQFVFTSLLGLVPPAQTDAARLSASPAEDAPLAPALTGLGTLHHRVSTSHSGAQQFFDQGLRLLYAFNHPESLRAFKEAARLDPTLAMAYWGQAMALSANLNAPMTPENGRLAHAAIERARALATSATAEERALIDALASRLPADGVGDAAASGKAYAEAMARTAEAHPDDPDIQTLLADALMNTMPWDYWQKDGTPKSDTTRVLATLERVMAAHPDHPGAHHYYIHLLEASNDPDRAVPSADRLGSLMPAAGHMVHMPSHIYIRVGRYADAAAANERAIEADEDYLSQCQAQGLYPLSYYPHNLHFLWAAATFEGRSRVAIDAARSVAAKVPHHHAGAVAWNTDFPVTPLLAYVRFGRWRDVLTEPAPPTDQPYPTGIWHYARGLAYVATGRLDRADRELAALTTAMGHETFSTTLEGSPLHVNLEIAARIVEAELAGRRGNHAEAVRLATDAVALEDGLPYNEPPVWHQAARQVLGALLLEAGRAPEAERAYREDLVRFRENGWSLFGLMQSLEAQGRHDEAAVVRTRFERAWQRADVTLTASRILADGAASGQSASRAIRETTRGTRKPL